MRRFFLLSSFATLAFAQSALKSPDGNLEIAFSADNGQLAYRVSFKGKPVLGRSLMGLDIQGQPPLGPAVRISGTTEGAVDETYTMPHGKANPSRNVAKTLTLELDETGAPSRHLTLEARAYNDGVAFRYVLPPQSAVVKLTGERTDFQFAKDATIYPLLLQNFRTSYEDNYHTLQISAVHLQSLIALPLLAELPGVAWVAITEANIDDFAGMYLVHPQRDGKTLAAKLAPSIEDPAVAVTRTAPFSSPWRVIMVADQPGRLVESTIVTNLNPPSAIADTSWIKPGKTAWDWWSGSWADNVDFQPGMNTATMKHYIDFASASGLEYMLIDAGWAARVTRGPNDSGSDLTRASDTIDMPALLAHAKAKNVRLWLWAHWADIDRQIDEVFPLFEKWGIAGVKIDFMDRDDQWMVNYYRRVLKKAAEHHLMIDFHGAYKPDGIERTWPNLMTREGVMGLEYNKWSARITPDHNVMLAFTRMLAGPLDYTPGAFRNVTRAAFEARNRQPMVMYTRAHSLALYAVFESGLQMVTDYPEAYKGERDFEFIKAAPATWDETRVLGGRPGESISVARRHGRDWFVGTITGVRPADIDISLEFLGKGEFMAEVYSDATDANQNPAHTLREEKRVTAATVMHVKMVSGGGQAIRIRPVR